MSEGFVLDTPAQINMWVLLSRRSQLKLQGKGIKTKGLFTALKREVGITSRKWDVALLELNDIIGDAGGPEDPEVNYLVWIGQNDTYIDRGIYGSLADVEAKFAENVARGEQYVITRTFEDVREADLTRFMTYKP